MAATPLQANPGGMQSPHVSKSHQVQTSPYSAVAIQSSCDAAATQSPSGDGVGVGVGAGGVGVGGVGAGGVGAGGVGVGATDFAITYVASFATPHELTPMGRRMKPLSPQDEPHELRIFQYGVDAVAS